MPTKKRIGAQPPEISKVFLRRLEELRGGRNHKDFADFLGVGGPRYNSWRNDGATPGGDAIRQIAERCNVSADWLLGIRGAAKAPTQAWDSATLETELSGEICRRLSVRAAGSTVIADGKQLLDRLTEDEWNAIEEWEGWRHHSETVPKALRAVAEQVSIPALGNWLRYHANRLSSNELPMLPSTRPSIARYGQTWQVSGPATGGTKKAQRTKSSVKRKRRNAS